MIYALYRALTTLGEPLIRLLLWVRMRRGKEELARLGERRGLGGRARPPGRLVWMHGASVGEAISLLPVVERVLAVPETTVLLTTGTVTSARLLAERLPEGAIHQYVPIDRPSWVRRFLDHWHPDLVLWAESEFWPNLLTEVKARSVPAVLLNGRISDRSFKRWARHPALIARLLGCFVLCLGQTSADAHRLRALGAPKVDCHGNLKFAAAPLPADQAALSALTRETEGRPRWLAASTHAGEEDIAGQVHLTLKARHPGLLTIVVPRHPSRGAAIAAGLTAMGLVVVRRSAGLAVDRGVDVLVADTMGEVGLFFRLSPIVFMGKSLIGHGGQNPLEPARLSASVLFGPYMENFTVISRQMLAAGAAEEVGDGQALAGAVDRRLGDSGLVARNGEVATAFALAQAHVLDAVLNELRPWLPLPEVVDEST